MFITLEGVEGSGKSTEIKFLKEYFAQKKVDCVFTREPGGTEIGGQIRRILLNPDNTALMPYAELLLYVADRVQHINNVILPALLNGRWVVCDRYFDATLAYQCYGRGLNMEIMRALHKTACRNLIPNFTVLFDLEPEQGLRRARGDLSSGLRGNDESRFEQEDLAFHHKIRNGYLALAKNEPNRFAVINAGGTPAAVHELFVAALENHLNAHDAGGINYDAGA